MTSHINRYSSCLCGNSKKYGCTVPRSLEQLLLVVVIRRGQLRWNMCITGSASINFEQYQRPSKPHSSDPNQKDGHADPFWQGVVQCVPPLFVGFVTKWLPRAVFTVILKFSENSDGLRKPGAKSAQGDQAVFPCEMPLGLHRILIIVPESGKSTDGRCDHPKTRSSEQVKRERVIHQKRGGKSVNS